MTWMARRLRSLGILLLVGLGAGQAAGQEPPPATGKVQDAAVMVARPSTMADLKNLSQCPLTQLYACSEAGALCVGFVRGEVLVLVEAPRFKKWLILIIWKGKHFDDQGGFINQWIGFKALHSCAYLGSSYYDGRTSIILE